MDVEAGRTEQFIGRLRSLFADTPYELVQNLENHYRNVVWLLFKLMGFYTQAEYHTSEGRIDLVVKTPKYCYVMEFKLDGTAEQALAQIQDKNYTLPFEIENQQIVRIGINSDSATRNIGQCLVGKACSLRPTTPSHNRSSRNSSDFEFRLGLSFVGLQFNGERNLPPVLLFYSFTGRTERP